MTELNRVPSVAQEDIPADLQRLVTAIEKLSGEQITELRPLVERVVESTKRRRRILTLVQEALSQLRLDMKYLMFDLEATRRERDECLEKLEGLEG